MSVGPGILQGLLVTLRHLFEARGDLFGGTKRTGEVEQLSSQQGIFTVQYPEERLAVPERLRYFPVLIVDEDGRERCTSCGICAKVCPPQCIWIERTMDENGKPIPQPKDFVIDTSICMSCGFCAEYCPFDAIKMDHNYELAAYERLDSLILHKDRLLVPLAYYGKTHPTDFAAEEEERRKKEEAERQKAEARAKVAAAKASGPGAGASERPSRPRTEDAGDQPEDEGASKPPARGATPPVSDDQ